MTRAKLLDELKRRPLLNDGAMGTQLMARGLAAGACAEAWNLDRADDVRAIHQAYIDAGCDAVSTNSFGATAFALEKHGRGGQGRELNRAAARLARAAAGDGRWVLGDLGPCGGFLEPLGDVSEARLSDEFRQQAEALYEGGADAVIVETMSDPGEMAVAVRAARQAADRPVIAAYAFAQGDAGSFRTMMGTTAADALAAALDAGASVVGANCGTSLSLDDYARLAEQLIKAARGVPVILQPNAGSPKLIDGQLVYGASPEAMAELAARLLSAGVRFLGGCCGTTPAHLAAMAGVIREA